MTIITHHGNGTCTALANGEVPFHELGLVQVSRLSHIVPRGRMKRWAFCRLRQLFGDRGRIAAWTRRWRGEWEVRFAWDTHTVVFLAETRGECIQWEIEYFTLNPP